MKNKVASYLKVLSVVLFISSLIGGLAIANKEVTKLNYKSSVDSKYDTYKTERVFDGTLFFTTLISSTIGCSLIYAFGELIDVVAEKNNLSGNTQPKLTTNENLEKEDA